MQRTIWAILPCIRLVQIDEWRSGALTLACQAALRNHVGATRALVKAGANPEKKNHDGKKPRDLTHNGDVIAYLSPADEPEDDEDDKKKKKKKKDDSSSDSD